MAQPQLAVVAYHRRYLMPQSIGLGDLHLQRHADRRCEMVPGSLETSCVPSGEEVGRRGAQTHGPSTLRPPCHEYMLADDPLRSIDVAEDAG